MDFLYIYKLNKILFLLAIQKIHIKKNVFKAFFIE